MIDDDTFAGISFLLGVLLTGILDGPRDLFLTVNGEPFPGATDSRFPRAELDGDTLVLEVFLPLGSWPLLLAAFLIVVA